MPHEPDDFGFINERGRFVPIPKHKHWVTREEVAHHIGVARKHFKQGLVVQVDEALEQEVAEKSQTDAETLIAAMALVESLKRKMGMRR